MDEDDPYDPDETRVIASGPGWREFDNGTVEYDPPHYGLPIEGEAPAPGRGPDYRLRTDHERGGGYNIRPAVTWEAARRDYLAGESAPDVCARYGLRLGTFRHRAASDGWRRADAPAPEPVDWMAMAAELGPPDLTAMAGDVLLRLRAAILAGRPAEAAAWMRIWRTLSDSVPTTSEPEPVLPTAPDPLTTAMRDLNEVEAIARDAAALAEDDEAGRAALEIRMAALAARARVGAGARTISDGSDDLDPVFSVGDDDALPDPLGSGP